MPRVEWSARRRWGHRSRRLTGSRPRAARPRCRARRPPRPPSGRCGRRPVRAARSSASAAAANGSASPRLTPTPVRRLANWRRPPGARSMPNAVVATSASPWASSKITKSCSGSTDPLDARCAQYERVVDDEHVGGSRAAAGMFGEALVAVVALGGAGALTWCATRDATGCIRHVDLGEVTRRRRRDESHEAFEVAFQAWDRVARRGVARRRVPDRAWRGTRTARGP